MNTQSKPTITKRFNPDAERYEYITVGHIGSELFKQIVFSDYYERVIKIERTYENNNKVTKGFL